MSRKYVHFLVIVVIKCSINNIFWTSFEYFSKNSPFRTQGFKVWIHVEYVFIERINYADDLCLVGWDLDSESVRLKNILIMVLWRCLIGKTSWVIVYNYSGNCCQTSAQNLA